MCFAVAGEVIYTAATISKTAPLPTGSLLRGGLSVSSRHRGSGMTSSSSATSSNSNNVSSDRHRDSNRSADSQLKISNADDPCRDLNRPNRLHLQNGMPFVSPLLKHAAVGARMAAAPCTLQCMLDMTANQCCTEIKMEISIRLSAAGDDKRHDTSRFRITRYYWN